jgi:chromosome segregation ATPase
MSGINPAQPQATLSEHARSRARRSWVFSTLVLAVLVGVLLGVLFMNTSRQDAVALGDSVPQATHDQVVDVQRTLIEQRDELKAELEESQKVQAGMASDLEAALAVESDAKTKLEAASATSQAAKQASDELLLERDRNIASLQVQLADLKATNVQLTAERDAANQRAADAETLANGQSAQITNLGSQVASLESQIADYQDLVSNMEAERSIPSNTFAPLDTE